MALQNEILVPRFNNQLQKILGIKDAAPAPQLATDLSAGITLEQERPEWEFLGGVKVCGASTTQNAGGAGFMSELKLYNPATSGALGILERIHCGSDVATTCRIGWFTAAPTVGQGAALDARWYPGAPGGISSLSASGSNNAAAVILVSIIQVMSPALISAILTDVGLVIPPGFGIVIDPGIVNRTLHASIVWRERAYDPAERR